MGSDRTRVCNGIDPVVQRKSQIRDHAWPERKASVTPTAMNQRPITVDIFPATKVIASDGVTKGEALSFADELVMDDVFRIDADATLVPLKLIAGNDALRRASPATASGDVSTPKTSAPWCKR